jgi:putative Ca2+/H+ antiporter (TMEM165/GDT1 family)
MDWKLLGLVFGQIFVAELGDKTQLATFTWAARNPEAKLSVFAGAALALVVSAALGVLAGQAITAVVSERALRWIAGLLFIGIGIWTLLGD